MLCNVCYRLQQEGYDIVLLLAGEKQKRRYIQISQRYFSDRIKYLGERNDVLDLLSASDIFACLRFGRECLCLYWNLCRLDASLYVLRLEVFQKL